MFRLLLIPVCSLMLSGCAVVAIADAAVSVTAGVVGLAADATIGTVKIVGKGVGAAADAAFGDDEDEKKEEKPADSK
jgi:hypothetical protein